MNMKKSLVILIVLFGLTLYVKAQDVKRPNSYNYTRGVEAVQNNNAEEALDYLNKEVKENPENGYAFVWIAVVRNHIEDYGRALTAIDLAVKYIPKKDKEYKAYAYALRGDIFLNLEEIQKALKDYTLAIETDSENEDIYEKRAQLYYELKEYSLGNNDYQKIIQLNPGSVIGYMGIGRNANAQKKYEEAIKQFDYVVKLASNYSSGYAFRAESYIGLKKYNQAIDDVIKALDTDYDRKALYLMEELADSAFVQLVAKLKVQYAKESNDYHWPYCLGKVYEQVNDYKKAIDYYQDSYKKNPSDLLLKFIATCYDELGNYSAALDYINQAMQMDSTNYQYVQDRADIYVHAGMRKEAIQDMDLYISKYPDYFFGYYRRGWFKDHGGDTDGALEDYTMAITLEPSYAYTYLNRGSLYQMKGMKEEAETDYKMIVELDTVPESYSCAQYAHFYLGNNDKAIECLKQILKNEDSDGNNYEATCLYSLMGDTEMALYHLRRAFEKGYRKFSHIRLDRDLNNIRQLKEFEKLLLEYEQKYLEELKTSKMNDEGQYEDVVTEIPFTKEGEVLKVKCNINSLPLYFIFDTGASDVSMSDVEANFMLKNDYLLSQDILGKQNYLTADGNISEGTVINLRNVNFGGLDLNNVKASIVKNQKAPLLLGQSVLNRLGKIEIDNEKRMLKITFKKKIE